MNYEDFIFNKSQIGRKAIGVELKSSYYKQAVRNLKGVENESEQRDLIPT